MVNKKQLGIIGIIFIVVFAPILFFSLNIDSEQNTNESTNGDRDTGNTGAGGVFQDVNHYGNDIFNLTNLNSTNGFFDKVHSIDWTNVSITESQISDFQDYILSSEEGNLNVNSSDLLDGEDGSYYLDNTDVLAELNCNDKEIAKWNDTSGQWECAGDEVGEEGSGESNDGSNIGTDGVGVYDGKSSTTLQFRNIATSLSKYLSVVFDSNDNDIDLDFNETELNKTIDDRDDYEPDTNCSEDQSCDNVLYTSDEYIGGLSCSDEEVAIYDSTSGNWECGNVDYEDTNTEKAGGEPYLYNDSDYIYLNESELNNTIDSRDQYEEDTNIIDDDLYNSSELEEQTDGKLGIIDSFINTLIDNRVTQSFVNALFPDNDLTTDNYEENTDNQTLSVDSTNINDTISIEDGNTITIHDNYEADTVIGNCSEGGSCELIVYDSDTTEWDKDKTDDFTDLSNFTGTLEDGKVCIYDSTDDELDCSYTDQYEEDTNDYVDSISVTGTDTKTITLTRTGGLSDLTADFTDRFEEDTNCSEDGSCSNVLYTSDEYIGGLSCADNEVAKYDSDTSSWECSEDVSGGTAEGMWIDQGDWLAPNSTYAENVNVTGNLSVGSGSSIMDIYDDGSKLIFDILNPAEFSNSINVTSGNDICIEGDKCLSDAGTGGGDITAVLTDSTPYLFNGSTSGDVDLNFNETYLNNTIDSRDSDTTYSASGTLLDLTDETFSVNEGTLTDGKICTYVSGTGLVCDYEDQYEADTNETARFNNLTDGDCSGTDKVVGVDSNGNVVCDSDEDTNTNIIDDNLYNSSELEEQGDGNLGIVDSFINGLIDNRVTQSFVNDLFPNNDLTVDNIWDISGDYLFNDSNVLTLDESKLNDTIDARDDYEANTDNQTLSVDSTNTDDEITISNGNTITIDDDYEENTDASTKCSGTDTYLSGDDTCETDSDTTYTAGDGLDLTDEEFSNTDKGSDAVSTHESDYNHDNFLTNIEGESIGDLDDVDLTDNEDNKILKYNSGTGNFEVADDEDTTYTSSDFNHDDLTGFVENEHIDWTTSQTENIHEDNYEDTNTQLDDQAAEDNVDMNNNNVTSVDCVKFSNGAQWCGQ